MTSEGGTPAAGDPKNQVQVIVTACPKCSASNSNLSINTSAIALPLLPSISIGEVISTIGAGLATAAEVTVASAAATVLAVGVAGIYIQDTYFPPGAIGYLPRGINGGSDNTLARRPVVLPISQAFPRTYPLPLTFTLPHNETGTPTKVYDLGGWDISTLKWVTLKYGVASTMADTYGGLGNRRPDGQLGGKLGDALRGQKGFSNLLIRQITIATVPSKEAAHHLEWLLVQRYKAANGGFSPPLQGLPF